MSCELLTKVANILGGDSYVKVIEALRRLGRATDDELANQTKLQLNEARKILYALHKLSLVDADRTRDDETGWLIFHWKLQLDNVEGFVANQKRKILDKLRRRLDYEQTHEIYACANSRCAFRVAFGEAMELVFHCPKCGGSLNPIDNRNFIKTLKSRIVALEEELREESKPPL